MKKLLGIVVLVLMWCNVGFAEERYNDLVTKSKTGKGDVIIEVLNEMNLAYELETSFVEDCVYELKVFKEKDGKKCSKMKSRIEGVQKLLVVALESNFQEELLEVGKEIDNGKRSKTDAIRIEKLMNEFLHNQEKITELYKKVNFLLKNL